MKKKLTKKYKKECLLCGDVFKTHTGRKLYCGSYVNKTGCSYMKSLINAREAKKKYHKTTPQRETNRTI